MPYGYDDGRVHGLTKGLGLPPIAVRIPRNAIAVLAGAFGVLDKGHRLGAMELALAPSYGDLAGSMP